jgi:hypothetical protein
MYHAPHRRFATRGHVVVVLLFAVVLFAVVLFAVVVVVAFVSVASAVEDEARRNRWATRAT